MRSVPTLARFLLPLGAAIVLAVSFAGRPASQASGTTIGITPASQVAHMGQAVEFDIAVTGVNNLGAWQVQLHWDPAVLTYDSSSNGAFLGSSGRSPSCIPPETNAATGTAKFACGTVSSGATPEGPSGDGVLVHVKFTPAAEGTTNIEFSDVQLANWDSIDCCPGFTFGEGAVTVSAADNAPLPATPTPNAVKLTPTAIPGFTRPDELSLRPGANATAAAGGTPAPVGASGGPSGGSTSSGATGDVAGIGNISGSGSGATGGTGVPHAGDGTQIRSRSTLVDVLTGLLAAAGLICVAAAARAWRPRRR